MIFLNFPDGNWAPFWIFKSTKFYLLRWSGGPRHVTYLCQKWSIHRGNIAIFQDGSCRHLGFSNLQNFIDIVLSRITMQNFVKIGLFVAKILRIFKFSRWPLLPSWIFEIAKFYWLTGPEGRYTWLFQILSKSVNQLQRFFLIFQYGCRPPSWIWLGLILTTLEEYLLVSTILQNLLTFQKYGSSIFGAMAGKRYSRPHNWRFSAIWPPKWRAISTEAKKAHPWVSLHRLSHQTWISVGLTSPQKRYK